MASTFDSEVFLAAELEEWVGREEVTDRVVEVASAGADGGDTRADRGECPSIRGEELKAS